MNEPNTNTPAAPAQPTPPAGTGGQPANWEAAAHEWEERFKGMQRTLNTKEAAWLQSQQTAETTIAKLTQEAREVQTVREGLAAQLKELQGQSQALTGERDQFKTDAATSGQKLARLQAIAQHPTLLEAEGKGLLRTDLQGDDFAKFLTEYAAHFSTATAANKANFLQGGVPAAGSTRTGASATKDVLMAQLNEAMSRGDRAAYDQVYNQLVGLTQPK